MEQIYSEKEAGEEVLHGDWSWNRKEEKTMGGQRPRPHRTNSVFSATEKVTPYQTVDNSIWLPKNPVGLARIRKKKHQKKKNSLALICADRTGLAESYHHTDVQLQSCLLLLKSLRHIEQEASLNLLSEICKAQ